MREDLLSEGDGACSTRPTTAAGAQPGTGTLRRRRWPRPCLAVVLAFGASAAGCGPGAHAGGGTTPRAQELPDQITADSYGRARRTFHRMPLDEPSRQQLREQLVDYLSDASVALIGSDDYDAVLEHFAEMTSLYRPEEIEQGRLPRALEAPARFVLQRASRRGDEARALSALLVLGKLEPDEERNQREYRRVADWGQEARKHLDNPLARHTQLIAIWEEHARLTPTPEVLDAVASLHVERRNALVRAVRSGDGLQVGGRQMLRQLAAPHQLLQRAPFDVAAVYLQHGNIAAAITQLEAMGDDDGVQRQLLRVLRDARNPGTATDAMYELAEAYREAKPEVALGLCHQALRQAPDDPRFPACLARVAFAEERYADATAWYAEAIDLAPNERKLYDEALEKLNELIKEGLFEAEPTGAREAAKHAERILEQRLERWPGSEPPVAPGQLHLLVGRLEMNAGNPKAARKWFERSIEADETAEALMQLGLLEERTGQPRRSVELYRRALDMTPPKDERSLMRRAEILEHLGDGFRAAGAQDDSKRRYERALELWADGASKLQGPPLALVQVRRGVLLDRLDRHKEAVIAFREAMAAAPHLREGYAGILSHLVVAEPADPELAHEVFRRAQRHLTLEPEWKVYFALWVDAINGRAGVDEPMKDVQQLLEKLSDSSAWWGRLAKFGAGELPYEELLSEASDIGQRTEAYFYEGSRRIASGDSDGAAKLFERVLSSAMVNFYEFAMAQELLVNGTAASRRSGSAEPQADHRTNP